jgi:hypothetical protein
MEVGSVFLSVYPESVTRQVDKYFSILDDFVKELKQQDITLLLVLIPDKVQLDDPSKSLSLQQKFIDYATNNDVIILDLFPAFQQVYRQPDNLFLTPYDGHPNPKAYQVAAEAITQKIIDLFL